MQEELETVNIITENKEEILIARIHQLSKNNFLNNGRSSTENLLGNLQNIEVIRLLEATSNYDFYNTVEEYEEYQECRENIVLHFDSLGVVEENELISTYNLIFEKILASLDSMKVLVVNDLIIVDSTSNSYSITINILTATPVISEVGKINVGCEISNEDYWYPCFDQGKCGAMYEGDFYGLKDGHDMLNEKLQCSFEKPNCSEMMIIYDVVTINYIGQLYYFAASDTYIDLPFNSNDCMGPYYYRGFLNGAIHQINAMKPLGKFVKSGIIDYVTLYPEGSDYIFLGTGRYANYTCENYPDE